MSRKSTRYVKAALSALHYTGIDGLVGPLTRGLGCILTLHQVGPDSVDTFCPNRILRITPYFLERTIHQLLEAGFECVAMDEVAIRLRMGNPNGRPFVAFTLDDAYRDNLTNAAPIFRRYGVPYCIYAPTDGLDGRCDLWWLVLEEAIRRLQSITIDVGGEPFYATTETTAGKDAAFYSLYWRLRQLDETEARTIVRQLANMAAYDPGDLCADLVMNWDELREIAADPLATIGGHTVRHYALAKLGAGAARYEMEEGVRRLEASLGRRIKHFSYPFGDRKSADRREFDIARSLGFETAVTTRKGLLRSGEAHDLMALPRISLNGDYQDPLYTKVLLSGLPFALLDLARKVVPVREKASA